MYRPCIFLSVVVLITLACVNASAQDIWNNFAAESASQPAGLETTPQPAPKILLILDPGHGGTDLGARTSKGVLEKNVTIRLAKTIRSSMSTTSEIETRLTRKADVTMSALERIQLANSSHADLYISLHADGGMGPHWRPLKIFVCSDKAKKNDGGWSSLNKNFTTQTMRLANHVAKNLKQVQKKRGVDIVKNGRVDYLCGVAMPAIMIEPVDMSNPDDELSVEKDEYIGKLGSAIARAIDGYLAEQGLVSLAD